MKGYIKLAAVLIAVAALAACAAKPKVKEDIGGGAGTVVVPEDKDAAEKVVSEDLAKATSEKQESVKYSALAEGDEVTKSAEAEGKLVAVHFDFDKYFIRDEDKAALKKNAEWLKLNSAVKVQVEGHADERGDNEYNLALGEKRATSVKKYLEGLGIKKDRMTTISYGEEKPVNPGHDEDAWAKNRRAEFMIQR